MQYSIESFWRSRLQASQAISADASAKWNRGWCLAGKRLGAFVEAPLNRSMGYGETDPEKAGIVLVSAPAAVGKTTLARQIASETGAVFVDLAQAASVGAGTLTGGLAGSNMYDSFQSGNVALIVDGLDEARVRVTQSSMDAFLQDAVSLATDDSKPIVLFGRTRSIEDAWLWFSEEGGIDVPILEIDYFDKERALEFVKKRMRHIRGETGSREPDVRAAALILEKLPNQTLKGGKAEAGREFSGYSPVLIAVAERVAAPKDSGDVNPQKLIAQIEQGREAITLQDIADAIMEREQSKLAGLKLQDPKLSATLYIPKEQIARLISRLYGNGEDIDLPRMSAKDQETYRNALETWVVEHPFLDGDGRAPSSEVFGGLLAAHAIHGAVPGSAILSQELGRKTSVNPFLAEFYMSLLETDGHGQMRIPLRHVGIVYSSICARLSLGEYASLLIDVESDDGSSGEGLVEIEIVRAQADAEPDRHVFSTDSEGDIVLNSHLEDVEIVAPKTSVALGSRSEAVLVSPIYIEAGLLILKADSLVADVPSMLSSNAPNQLRMVQLVAGGADTAQMQTRPTCRNGAALEVTWPDIDWPWRDYFEDSPWERNDQTGEVEEGSRRLKKILRLFRSHGKKDLAKCKAAIDHRRRTRGVGLRVLERMLEEGILEERGYMYTLSPDKLAEATGLNFHDVRSPAIPEETVAFIRRALRGGG